MTHEQRLNNIKKLVDFAKKHKKETPAMLRMMLADQCRHQGFSANTIRDYVSTVMSKL